MLFAETVPQRRADFGDSRGVSLPALTFAIRLCGRLQEGITPSLPWLGAKALVAGS